MNKYKIFKYSASIIFLMQTEAFIFSGKAFKYYDKISEKGKFTSKEEILEFHRKFGHIGFYPFTILPSIYYGMNYITIENGLLKVYTNQKFIKKMEKMLEEGVKELFD